MATKVSEYVDELPAPQGQALKIALSFKAEFFNYSAKFSSFAPYVILKPKLDGRLIHAKSTVLFDNSQDSFYFDLPSAMLLSGWTFFSR